jgi:hypothetical protein
VAGVRPAGAAGLAAAVLFLAGFALLATPPEPAAAPEEIAGYLDGHRGRVFAATGMLGAGSCLFAWYLAGLLRLVGGVRGVAAALAAAGAAGLVVAAMSLLSGVALRVPPADLALLGWDVFNALVTMGGFGFGFSLLVASAGHALPARLRAAGWAVGLGQLATIPGLAVEQGPFAPLGPVALIAFWALTLWYAAVAVVMLRA